MIPIELDTPASLGDPHDGTYNQALINQLQFVLMLMDFDFSYFLSPFHPLVHSRWSPVFSRLILSAISFNLGHFGVQSPINRDV